MMDGIVTIFLMLDMLVVGFTLGAVFQHIRWIKERVFNCDCDAPAKGEKFHRTNCRSYKNTPPKKETR